MKKKLTVQELEEIKQREAAVISDGWFYNGTTILQTHNIPVIWTDGEQPRMNEENGNFIAHSRTDIPDLLNHVEFLESEIEYQKELVKEYQKEMVRMHEKIFQRITPQNQ